MFQGGAILVLAGRGLTAPALAFHFPAGRILCLLQAWLIRLVGFILAIQKALAHRRVPGVALSSRVTILRMSSRKVGVASVGGVEPFRDSRTCHRLRLLGGLLAFPSGPDQSRLFFAVDFAGAEELTEFLQFRVSADHLADAIQR